MSDTTEAPAAESESPEELEGIASIADEIIEGYGLREDLGDRALILPDPAEKAPMMPFGSMEPILDTGWADNATIAEILARAHRRDRVFVRGEPLPALIMRQDRNRNPGFAYYGEDELLTVLRQKRAHWYVLTGEAHPAGGRQQIAKAETYTEAVNIAQREAKRFPPAILMGRNITMHENGIENIDWSIFKDCPESDPPTTRI